MSRDEESETWKLMRPFIEVIIVAIKTMEEEEGQ